MTRFRQFLGALVLTGTLAFTPQAQGQERSQDPGTPRSQPNTTRTDDNDREFNWGLLGLAGLAGLLPLFFMNSDRRVHPTRTV
jgi:hypothetical protein